MDSFWFWAKLAWDVGVAWFGTWTAWVQVLALLFMVYALLWLLYLTVSTPVRIIRWVRWMCRTRMAQAQRQALERVLVQALEVATAADERMAMDETSRSVMDAFERVAAAAWRGEMSE